MTNNEIIKKITIALSLHHDVVREIFLVGGQELTSRQAGAFLVGESNKNYKAVNDEVFAVFLEGLIEFSRGSKEDPEALPQLLGSVVEGLAEQGKADALESLKEMVDEVYEELSAECHVEND